MNKSRLRIVSAKEALAGRSEKMPVIAKHTVLGTALEPPFSAGIEQAMFGMGCFWGAERKFWTLRGVHSTAVGYSGGSTPNPTYREVCTGQTGHNEVVLVAFDPQVLSYSVLLKTFWENHDPTTLFQQGNDIGTQYRSGIYCFSAAQKAEARDSLQKYQAVLSAAGFDPIVTEIEDAGPFYFAEDYHQQYLHKNPDGYCGLGGTGVACPVGLRT
jgi:peptide-methionine (S)-S-oxide reductase